MIPSLGSLNKPQRSLLWGNLKAYFVIQFPARTAWGFVFEPSSSTSSTTPTSAVPTTTLPAPLFGHSKQTLPSSLGSGGANGRFNRLYQIGGPRPPPPAPTPPISTTPPPPPAPPKHSPPSTRRALNSMGV